MRENKLGRPTIKGFRKPLFLDSILINRFFPSVMANLRPFRRQKYRSWNFIMHLNGHFC